MRLYYNPQQLAPLECITWGRGTFLICQRICGLVMAVSVAAPRCSKKLSTRCAFRGRPVVPRSLLMNYLSQDCTLAYRRPHRLPRDKATQGSTDCQDFQQHGGSLHLAISSASRPSARRHCQKPSVWRICASLTAPQEHPPAQR